ncbi:MAG TPA: phage holin family protein [Gammaproteobacteria bacterium]|nr:phage holin family protein [Gammaproteobacteria bacterium]
MAVHDINREARERELGEYRTLRSLFGELANEFTTLFRQEVALARAETSESISQARSGIVWLAAGGVIAFASLIILLMAAVYGLSEVMHPGWAALIVGGVALVIGLIAMASGRSHLRARSMMPRRTVESIRRDKDLATRRMQ